MPAQAQSDPGDRSRWPASRDAAPYLATLAAFCAFSFLSGGYVVTRAAPIAVTWLVAASVWVWVMRVQSRPSKLYLAALAALAAYTVWAGLSILWSFGPDLSWTAFNYSALYLAVAALLGVTPTGPVQLRLAAYGFLVVCLAVGLYAFAGKVLPELVTHAHTYARLDSPVGYWNVLALLMVMALPVTLSLAARRGAPTLLRATAAAAGVPLALTFVFAFSRGGVVALAVVLAAYFALSDRRLASFASLAAIAAVVAAVLWLVRDLGTLFRATDDDALRTLEGHVLLSWSLVALVIVFCLQVGLVILERGVAWRRTVRVVAGTAILICLAIGLGGGAWVYIERQGGIDWVRDRYHLLVSDADTRSSADTAGRLLSLNTGRPPLWRDALEQYEAGPRFGTGAGTYRFTYYRFRDSGGVTKHAHSQWLNALSELGLPGLVSIAVAMALFLAAATRGLRRGRRDPERVVVSALQAALIAFVVHMTWDWDWDMAAAALALIMAIAVTSSYITCRDAAPSDDETPAADAATRTEDAPRLGARDDATPAARRARVVTPGRVFASGLLLLVAASWVPPYLGDRAQNRAVEEAARGDVVAAAETARSARRWDPLAAEPLITLALIEQQLGQNRAALDTLRAAVKLQPQNYEVHYQLGLLLERAFDRDREAAAEFRRALELNPRHQSSAYELEALAAGG